ncbi:MAG: hypothetical protein HRT35_09050 [Algicola sp.]|nr:hypothetical protein [Algicola sp.]
MKTNRADHRVIQWFHGLTEEDRYRFSTQWMKDEADISINKLADFLTDGKRNSDALIKSFRSFDMKNDRLNGGWRPKSGYTTDDVHEICHAINRFREQNNRSDRVCANEFYQRAKEELSQSAIPEQPVVMAQLRQKNISIKLIALPVLLIVLGLLLFQLLPDEEPKTKSNEQYLPGNVVQLHQLKSPEHYLSAKTCYPNLMPESQPSTIESSSQLLAMPLAALDHKTILLPELLEETRLLHSSTVSFEGLRRWYIAKGMINLGISDTCMASMQQIVDYGNQIEDYAIIKQTFVADVIHFDLMFTEQATDSQIAVLSEKIAAYFIGKSFTGNALEITDKGRITIKGPVTVAYISQPMSARISK